MKNLYITIATVALGLSACSDTNSTAPVDVDPITAAISGKTLVGASSKFKLEPNGALVGTAGDNSAINIVGAWAIRDGQWCRTLSEPPQLAGTECQNATLGDGTITIDGQNGPVTYLIE